jgi:uncharacterized protein YndB with AHSA1/START domain
MRNATRGYAQFVEVPVGPQRVWQALIDPLELQEWHAIRAEVEPRQGGRFRTVMSDGRARDAVIDVYDPGRRLRLLYYPDATMPGAATIADDLLLDARADKTVVRVLGAGIPEEREWDPYYKWLRVGWIYRLAELKKWLAVAPMKVAQ